MPKHSIHGLSDRHYDELFTGSKISDDRIRQRYYQSATADQLPPDFADYQRRPGLLIPIRSVRGYTESWQLKPDQPRIGKNGKPIKYETAANCPQIIDCPPSAYTLLADPNATLIITEGAKKVDAAVSAGLWTTIGLQGVYGWRGKNEHGGTTALSDWELIALNGREVVIAFDSDVMTKETVRGALDRLAGFLRSRKADVRYLVLPDLPNGDKCGLDDFFANGGQATDLDQYLVDVLPAPSMPSSSSANGDATSDAAREVPRLVTRSMSEVEKKQIDWLWPNWLPKGMLTLLGGYAGDGKSTLTMALAAALSTGGALPDGSRAPVTKTLLILTEDDVSHVVKERLELHGMESDLVKTLDYVEDPDGTQRGFNLRTDVPQLREKVVQEQIGLVVIDPLSGVLSQADRNNEGEMRDTFAPLITMMEDTGVAVIGIMHIGKNDGQAKAFQKLMGSTAFTALARSVWMVSNLPDEFQAEGEPVRKMLGVAKSNYAVAPPPLQYHRPQDSALEFLGVSPISLDQAFSWKPKAEKGQSETEKAEEWLLEFMDGKRVLASAVEDAAKEEGFGMTTMKRAKLKLGIKSEKEQQQWYWRPPVDESVIPA